MLKADPVGRVRERPVRIPAKHSRRRFAEANQTRCHERVRCERAARRVHADVVAKPDEFVSLPPPEPSPLRPPPDLATFPWDLARSKLGFAGADLLMLLGILLVRAVNELKDE